MGAKWTEPELAQLDKSAQKHADNHKGSGPLLMPSKTFITKEFYAAFPTSTRTSRAVEVLFDKRFSLGGKHGPENRGRMSATPVVRESEHARRQRECPEVQRAQMDRKNAARNSERARLKEEEPDAYKIKQEHENAIKRESYARITADPESEQCKALLERKRSECKARREKLKADEDAYEEHRAKRSRQNARKSKERSKKRKESYARTEAEERMDAALASFYQATDDEVEAGPSSKPLKGRASSAAAPSSSSAPSCKAASTATSTLADPPENAAMNYMAGLSTSSAPRKAEPERTRKRKMNSALTCFYEPGELEQETASSSKLRHQSAGKHVKPMSSAAPQKTQVRTQVNFASLADASLEQTSRATALPHDATSSATSSFTPSLKQARTVPRMGTSTLSLNQANSVPRQAGSNVASSSKRPDKQAGIVSSKTTSRGGSSAVAPRKQTNSTFGNTPSMPPLEAHLQQAAGPAPLKQATANGTPSLSPPLKTVISDAVAVHPDDATLKQAAGNAARKRPRLAQTAMAAPRSYFGGSDDDGEDSPSPPRKRGGAGLSRKTARAG